MEFREIYCNNCQKILGKYSVKYYPEAKIAELIKENHASHLRNGHQIKIRRIKK